MKKIIFLIGFFIFLGIFTLSYSQTYFSKRYDFNSDLDPDFTGDILTNGSGYIVFTGAVQLLKYYHYRFGFLRIDSLGNSIGTYKIFRDSIYSLGMGYPGSFIPTRNNSGYSIVGIKMVYVTGGRWDRGMLWRFDNNLDTLWSKTYSDAPPHDTSFLFRNFRELSDKGYIIVGSHGLVTGTAPIRINLHRVDSNGNLIWRKYYGSGNTYFLPFDVSRTSDGGYVIGAGTYPSNGSSSQDNDPVIIKTDSLGNQQWLKHLGNPNCLEDFAMVDLATDGNIICGTTYSDSCTGSDQSYGRINIVKINNTNNIIWNKKYGLIKHWLWLEKIKVLKNGDIIAIGHYDYYNENTRNEVGWILNTDSAGNEEWYREYSLLTAIYSMNTLYNVIAAPDGGFIACGTVWPSPPTQAHRIAGC
jgi:hypothetical protein